MNSYDVAVLRGLPRYPEVSSYDTESVKRLALDAEAYNKAHPYELVKHFIHTHTILTMVLSICTLYRKILNPVG